VRFFRTVRAQRQARARETEDY